MNNLNFCFENLSFDQILDNKEYYQKKIIDNKLIGFKKIQLSDNEHEKIASTITGVDEFYWIKKYNHHTLYQPDKETATKEDIKNFRDWCMHLDVTPIVDKSNNILDKNSHSSYVSMNMKTFKCDKKYGKTVFLDLIKLKSIIDDYIRLNIFVVKPSKEIIFTLYSVGEEGYFDLKYTLDYKKYYFYNNLAEDYTINILYETNSDYKIIIKQNDYVIKNQDYNIDKVEVDILDEIFKRSTEKNMLFTISK